MFFSLYRDKANQWRWTLYADNNRKIADSGEGYSSKQAARNGIALVLSATGNTPIREA